jgi:hypothetical protein
LGIKWKFTSITKNLYNEYLLIKIKNVNLNFTFIVYRSNSHGGIFRLCTRVKPLESGLYKGDTDYTTQTFIHIELQKFIVLFVQIALQQEDLIEEEIQRFVKMAVKYEIISGNFCIDF